MTGWLEAKRVRVIGSHSAVERGLLEAGAVLTDEEQADLLVHVAPLPTSIPAHLVDHAEWRAALDDGLDQRFHAASGYAAAQRGRSAPGAILFVGAPEQSAGAAQAAAAGALGNLTKTLGVEWARDGIRVNLLLTHESGKSVGRLAAYLLSDYAAYVTGAVMGVGLGD